MAQKQRKPIYAPSSADRTKHKAGWEKSEPGFALDVDGYPLSKCPRDFDLQLAQRLLDECIRDPGRHPRSPFPDRIYNVHEGVPYQAHQKQPGHYHGFPERPSSIHPDIREQLRTRASEAGNLDAYERWRSEVDDADA